MLFTGGSQPIRVYLSFLIIWYSSHHWRRWLRKKEPAFSFFKVQFLKWPLEASFKGEPIPMKPKVETSSFSAENTFRTRSSLVNKDHFAVHIDVLSPFFIYIECVCVYIYIHKYIFTYLKYWRPKCMHELAASYPLGFTSVNSTVWTMFVYFGIVFSSNNGQKFGELRV